MTTFLNNDGNIANALEVQNDNLEKVMGDGVQYMSSREIAELCEKRHTDVMRDIRRMLDKLGINLTDANLRPLKKSKNLDSPNLGDLKNSENLDYSNLSDLKNSENLTDPDLDSLNNFKILSYKDAKGEMRTEYLLDKNLSLTLVAGYNVVLRNRIINRWLELERKEQERETMEALDNPAALRKILLAYTGRVIALEDEVKKQDKYINYLEPNAVAFEKIGETDEDFTITQVSKMLDVKRNFLINFLQENNFIYRQNGKITPTNFAEAKGWLMFKVCKNGFSHTYITSKGCQAISLLFVKNFPNINFHK